VTRIAKPRFAVVIRSVGRKKYWNKEVTLSGIPLSNKRECWGLLVRKNEPGSVNARLAYSKPP
jgi:hypothetical protein